MPTVGVAMFSVLVASFILQRNSESKEVSAGPSTQSSPLGLRVVSTPQRTEILWNHDSSAIRGAEKGTIRISDGDIAESVPFDAPQLQDGALVYRPRTNDVSVRMVVDEQNGEQVSESVRVVTTP